VNSANIRYNSCRTAKSYRKTTCKQRSKCWVGGNSFKCQGDKLVIMKDVGGRPVIMKGKGGRSVIINNMGGRLIIYC
jgi:hypothetical protein